MINMMEPFIDYVGGASVLLNPDGVHPNGAGKNVMIETAYAYFNT